MELRDYIKIISKRIWIVIVVTIIFALGVYFITIRTPKSFDGSVSIDVKKNPEVSQNGEYNYDQYYALQASSVLSDTIDSWLKEPSNVIEIYNNASINLPSEKMQSLAKAIDSEKKQPSTISINISAESENSVRKILNSSVNFIQEKLKKDYDNQLTSNFEISYSNPAILEHKQEVGLNTILGLIAGFIISLVLVFITEYFSKEK